MRMKGIFFVVIKMKISAKCYLLVLIIDPYLESLATRSELQSFSE